VSTALEDARGYNKESLSQEEGKAISRLKDMVALVTGAAQGIGAGVSRVLAEHGATVILTDISDAVKVITKEITDMGEKAESFRMDVTDTEEVNRVVEEVLGRHGKIDILVNNAGIYSRARESVNERVRVVCQLYTPLLRSN
jgi:NAD(P)-dependent dehydrogenase (short-subunit alcohol dehydrogenase family)